ncbi:guanine nucleotide-binding protein subunit beta-like protein 1 isoform 2-T2 [Aplochiton taeniatus]
MSLPAPTPIYTLRGAGGAINTLHFSCADASPPLLYSGSGKGTVHVWNLTTRRAEKVLEGHSGNSVIWLNTLASRDALISQGRDKRVCMWDLSEGRSEVTESVWTGSVGFCHCSLLEINSGSWLLAHPGERMEEPDSGPGPLLLAGYEDGSLLLWDVSQRSVLSRVTTHPEPVMCLAFDPRRLQGISGSSDKNLWSWTLDGQQNLQVKDPVALINPGVSQLCVRGDCKILASAGWDHRVRVFGWKKLQPLAVLQHHSDMVLSVAFSDHQDPRSRLLAAGSKDRRISLWSICTEEPSY